METSGRPATTEQRQVLARWSGWGAVPQVFDRDHQLGKRFLAQVRAALGDDDTAVAAARQSTLNAHYTSPLVAEGLWKLATDLGFGGGDVIEPGSGPGVFFAAAPTDDVAVRMTGVELDPTTARICAAIHPEHTVVTAPLQAYKGSGFSAAIGNVPFADVRTSDGLKWTKDGLKTVDQPVSLHNYCIAKSLAALAPGGLLVALTSRYTLDSVSPAQRKQIARWGHFVGAVRLPNNTFTAQSGTSVVTDVVVFQRRPEPLTTQELPAHEQWWDTTEWSTSDGTPFRQNAWYSSNPDLVIGTPESGGMWGRDDITLVTEDPLEDLIPAALDNLASRAVLPYPLPDPAARADRTAVSPHPSFVPPAWAREGSIFVTPKGFLQITEGLPREIKPRLDPPDPALRSAPSSVKRADLKRRRAEASTKLAAMCDLRDVARELLAAEQSGAENTDDLRAEMGAGYDRAVAALGHTLIRRDDDGNMRRQYLGGFVADPDCVFLMGLEEDGPDGTPVKGPAFRRAMTAPVVAPAEVSTLTDAVMQSVGRLGRVDIEFMRSVTPFDWTEDDLVAEGLAFRNPDTIGAPGEQEWVAGPLYLAGDVRTKHAEAAAVASDDERYAPNVAALEKVLPPFVAAADIEISCGTTMLEPNEVEQMITDTLGSIRDLRVTYSSAGGWGISGQADTYSADFVSVWGTASASALRILDAAWSGRQVVITRPDPRYPDDPRRRIVDTEATALAAEKVEKWHDRLNEWMFDDSVARREEMERRWNTQYNRFVPPTYPSEWMEEPPGLSDEFRSLGLYEHQKTAAARIALGDDFLLGHCVGAGKTVTMAAGVMRMRQLGIRQKPLLVVPNQVVTQFGVEFMRAFPDAKVLMPPKGDTPGRRQRRQFASQSLWGDWDAVIVPHSFFNLMPLRPDTKVAHLQSRLAEVREDYERANNEQALHGDRNTSGQARRKRTIKQIEKQVARAEERLGKLLTATKDDDVWWEEYGFDYILVDEAHEFKNLAIQSTDRAANLTGAEKAEDLLMKIEVLRKRHPGKGVATLATGTPVSNRPSELWAMLRYLGPDLLESAGVFTYDAWSSWCTTKSTNLEPSPLGGGFAPRTRVSAYVNVPELRAMIDTRADIRTADSLGLVRPPLAGGDRQDVYAPASRLLNGWMDSLAERAVAPQDNKDILIALITSARQAAVDLSTVGIPTNPDRPSKLFTAADHIAALHREKADWRFPDSDTPGTLQLVFCDIGTPTADGSRTYGTLADALVERGVPADRIEFIHDYPSAAEKQDLFRRCRDGDVSVLVGSTSKMGTGVNVQTRLSDVHHLTLDWKPALMEQREGRGLRPGNLCPEVGVWYHIGEGTSDVMQLCVLRNKDAFIRQFIEGRERVIDVCGTDEDTLTYDDMMAHATGDSRAVALSEVAAEVATLQRQRNAARVAVRQATDLYRYTEQRLATSRSVYNELGAYSVVSLTAPFVVQDGHRPLNRRDATALLARAAYQRWRTANYAYTDQAETIAKVGDVPVWVRSRGRMTVLGVGPPIAKLSTSLQGGQVINAHNAACGQPVHGTVPDLERRIRNLLKDIPATRAAAGQRIPQLERDLESTAKAVNKAWPHHQLLARKTAKMEAIRRDINDNPIERPVPDLPVPTRAIAEAHANGEDVAALLDLLEVEHRGPEDQTSNLNLAADRTADEVDSPDTDQLAHLSLSLSL